MSDFVGAMILGLSVMFCFATAIENLSYDNEVSFSSRTSYRSSKKPNESFELPSRDKFDTVMMYGVFRHGARYPTLALYKRITKLANWLEGENHPLFKEVETERMKIADHVGELSNLGLLDQYTFGRRIAKELIQGPLKLSYDAGDDSWINYVHFESTFKSRAMDSMNSFGTGFFREFCRVYVPKNQSLSSENHLRFFDDCKQYSIRKKHVKELTNKFYGSKLFSSVRERVISTLIEMKQNVSDSKLVAPLALLDISNELITTLYNLCAYKSLINNVHYSQETFCQIFDKRSLLLMELLTDMQIELKIGLKRKSNRWMAIHLLDKIRGSIQSLADSPPNFQLIIGFGHAESVLPLLNLMGAEFSNPMNIERWNDNKSMIDYDLEADNIDAYIHSQRTPRYSRIIPMNGNIMILLVSSKNTGKKFIATYLNERPISISCCKNKYKPNEKDGEKWNFCPLHIFFECFTFNESSDVIFKKYCSIDNSAGTTRMVHFGRT